MATCKDEIAAEMRRGSAAAYRAHLKDRYAELVEAVRVVASGELPGWELYEASCPGQRIVIRQIGGGREVQALWDAAHRWMVVGVSEGADLVAQLRDACGGRAA
jgi:hypothetical protein